MTIASLLDGTTALEATSPQALAQLGTTLSRALHALNRLKGLQRLGARDCDGSRDLVKKLTAELKAALADLEDA